MAQTSDSNDGGGGTGSRVLSFLQEPLGIGLALGLVIAIVLGYFIL